MVNVEYPLCFTNWFQRNEAKNDGRTGRSGHVKGVLQSVQEAPFGRYARGRSQLARIVDCDVNAVSRDVRTKSVARIGVLRKISWSITVSG